MGTETDIYSRYLENIESQGGYKYNPLPTMDAAPLELMDDTDYSPDMKSIPEPPKDPSMLAENLGTASDIYDFGAGLLETPETMGRSHSAYNMPSQQNVAGAHEAAKHTAGTAESALNYGLQGAKIGATVGGPVGAAIGAGVGAIAGGIKGHQEKKAAKQQLAGIKQQSQMENQRYDQGVMSNELNTARSTMYKPTAYNTSKASYSTFM